MKYVVRWWSRDGYWHLEEFWYESSCWSFAECQEPGHVKDFRIYEMPQ